MNTQALHLDAAFSDALPPFNQRLVNSMFTLSTLVGLSVTQLTQGTIVGNLGFSEIAFPKPLFHGDTLYAETVVTDKRESKSRPGEGIVTLAHTARNQHGDVVATAVRKTMVRKKPLEESMPLDNAGPAWLFCPADRPERFEKAAAAADIVILDLEDGAGDKTAPRARGADRARRWTRHAPSSASTPAIHLNRSSTSRRSPHRVHNRHAAEMRVRRAGAPTWRRWTSC